MLNIFVLLMLSTADPVPVAPPTSWVDYPPSALRNEEQGVVAYELVIDAAGKPIDCQVTQSSGFASLDGETCRQLLRRGRFHPATDKSGKAQPGVYRNFLKWSYTAE